jgi:hypothetical protein
MKPNNRLLLTIIKIIFEKMVRLEDNCTWIRCHTHFQAAREKTGAMPSTHLSKNANHIFRCFVECVVTVHKITGQE